MAIKIKYTEYKNSPAATFWSWLSETLGYFVAPVLLLLGVYICVHFRLHGFVAFLAFAGCIVFGILFVVFGLRFCAFMLSMSLNKAVERKTRAAVQDAVSGKSPAATGYAGLSGQTVVPCPGTSGMKDPQSALRQASSSGFGTVRNLVCPFCGKDTLAGSHFCMNCGKDLSAQTPKEAATFSDPDWTLWNCRKCDAMLPVFVRYCHKCGWDQKMAVPAAERVPLWAIGPADGKTGIGDENLRMQQRLLEVAYLSALGVSRGSEEAGRLFPPDWYGSSDTTHLRALAEAIEKKIPIIQTDVWVKELSEGLR